MKLGEALSLRASQAQKLSDLRERIARNATVQEGDEPSEKVADLRAEHDDLSRNHRVLVTRIHEANVNSGLLMSLMEREHLRRQRTALEAAVRGASGGKSGLFRYSRNEIRLVPTVEIAVLQKELDALNEQIRNLDGEIQKQNWTTEI